MRSKRSLIFLGVFMSALAGIHLYLAKSLVLDLALDPAWQLPGLVVVGLLFCLAPACVLALGLLPRIWARPIVLPATLWLGFMFLLFSATLATDFLWWALGTPAQAAISGPVPPGAEQARTQALTVALLAGLGGWLGIFNAIRGPRDKRVEVWLERLPRQFDGFRIVQLSDLHIGPLLGSRFLARVVRRCNALSPDLVAITGDLVDGDESEVGSDLEVLRELQSPHGTFFVTGNHDSYSGPSAWTRRLHELGVQVLRNERRRISRGADSFELAGVDDYQVRSVPGFGEDLEAALSDWNRDSALVLLAHDPRSFHDARRFDVDLQLSGHTHGGQIWPFRYVVRLVQPWLSGLYREGEDRSQLYVSRGTGFWGPPMRLFAPAEITELVLRAGSGR